MTNAKATSRIISIVLLFLSGFLFYGLSEPETITGTIAIQKEIVLIENLVVQFSTDFDYGYELTLSLCSNQLEFNEKQLDFELRKNDEVIINKMEVNNKDQFLISQYFSAKSGNIFQFVINQLDEKLEGIKADLKVDVTGGGPSVGLALGRWLRPHLWKATLVMMVIAILLGTYGFKKRT